MDVEAEKRAAAHAAAELVEDGMRVGLGTGSTVAYLLPALAARGLTLRCVATSVATEHAAKGLGLPVEPFDALVGLDIAIDGADQVAPDGWLVKGGGGAHTREKIVALAATRFVVIASSDKDRARLTPPIALELLPFGLAATLHALGDATVRADAPAPPPTAASSPTSPRRSTIPHTWPRASTRSPGWSSTGSSPPPWSPTSWWREARSSSTAAWGEAAPAWVSRLDDVEHRRVRSCADRAMASRTRVA